MTAPATAQAPGAANPSPIGALSRLVQNANDSGISYQQMADKASRVIPGLSLTKQYFQKLVKMPPVSPPNPDQMEAIAAALGIPGRRVKEAAAEQWLNYEATELAGYDEDVRIIVGHLAGKTKAELRRWRAMIEADERAQREE
jgi:hypothetical protein